MINHTLDVKASIRNAACPMLRTALAALCIVAMAAPAASAKRRVPTMTYERAYSAAYLAASQLGLYTGGFGHPAVNRCRRLNRTRWNCDISSVVPPNTPSAEHGTSYTECTAVAKVRWRAYESIYTARIFYRALAYYRGTLRCSGP